MTVPYTFGTATTSIPLSNLDANFNTPITLGNTSIYLGNTTTTIGNLTLTNATISSGNVTISNVTVTTANVTNITVSGTTTLSGLTASTALALDASKNVVSITNTGTGNNVLSASPTLTGTIAGASLSLSSLTSGRVTYAGASGLLSDSANLVWDNTNARLGIGTASPSYILDIQKTASAQLRLFSTNNSTGSQLILGSGTGTGTTSQYIYFDNSLILSQASVTDRVTINSSGFVGIGTSNPTAKLQVKQSSTDTLGIFVEGSANDSQLRIYNNGTVSGLSSSYGTTGSYMPLAFLTSDTERMRIDSAGNVGIGVTPSTWNVGRAIQIGTSGDVSLWGYLNSAYLSSNAYYNSGWIYKATAAATQYLQQSGQHIWYNAPSGTAANAITFTQAMTLDSSGNLLVGTTSTNARLRVVATSSQSNGIYVTHVNSGNDVISCENSATTGNNVFIAFYTDATVSRGSITYNRAGGLVVYGTTSDYRLKKNIVDLPNALQTVLQLKPRQFDWKETGNTTTGFIAHELAEICPHAVIGSKDDIDDKGNPKYQNVDTSFLVATLTKAIQELKIEFDAYKATHP